MHTSYCAYIINMSYNSSPSNIAVISNTEGSNVKRLKRKNTVKYFREYCENSTIHGFKYLAEKKRSIFERCLWGFFILISVAACCYLISRIYRKYQFSPVIVSFATKESPIFTIPFPAVTICPMSKTSRTKFNFTKVYHAMEDGNDTIITPAERLRGQYMSLLCDRGTELFPDNATFTDEFYEVIHELKISKNVLFGRCLFMGKEISCQKIFTPIILDEGLCYTFNMLGREEIFSDKVKHFSNYHKNVRKSKWNIDRGYLDHSKIDLYPRRALLSGADNALHVTLMHSESNTDYVCIQDVQGYSVLLHSPDTIPRIKKQYFQVPFHTAVIAVVQPKMMTTSEEVKKYAPADRECYFTDERPLKFFKIYTPDNCRLECLTNYTLKRCGCVNFFMPRDNSTDICGNGNWECMSEAENKLKLIQLENYISYTEEEEITENSCDCMPLCTELSYDMEQSQTEWNWSEQLRASRLFPEKMSKLISKRINFVKLSVFFKLEQFLTSQRNELYGPTDFLANFGGLLGLFTGFSILSLIEIVYFLTLRIFCNKRRYKVWTGLAD